MEKAKQILITIILSIFLTSFISTATASPPDITGQWCGVWEIPGIGLGDFTMDITEDSYGFVAVMNIPALGVFEQPLPVTIEEENPDELVFTVGLEGILEFGGVLVEESMSGVFTAYFPLFYSGTWQATRYIDPGVDPCDDVPEVFSGEAPGEPCDDIPPLFCIGDSETCSELLLFEPTTGEGYTVQDQSYYQDNGYSYIRRDLMMPIKYATAKIACKSNDWDYGNFAPLGLLDMSEADGSTPGTSIGHLWHPPGTHVDGRDLDTAYYQLNTADNLGRPVGDHHVGCLDVNHLVSCPYALDVWRTALYIAYISEHPRVRVIGVDGQIGLVLEDALDDLVDMGWINAGLRESIPLVYEVEDMGWGFYYYHHHHMHISMNYLYDIVAALEIGPQTLNRKSKGQFVTAHIEFVEGLEASQIDLDSVALILNGDTMLYAKPENTEIIDYNENGILDLSVKFDRQDVLGAIDNGAVEISITGLADGLFFQESQMILVLGERLRKLESQPLYNRPNVPINRPGGRKIRPSE